MENKTCCYVIIVTAKCLTYLPYLSKLLTYPPICFIITNLPPYPTFVTHQLCSWYNNLMSSAQISLSLAHLEVLDMFVLLMTVDCCLGFVFLCGFSLDFPCAKSHRVLVDKFQGTTTNSIACLAIAFARAFYILRRRATLKSNHF
jgi:hypothetical protein